MPGVIPRANSAAGAASLDGSSTPVLTEQELFAARLLQAPLARKRRRSMAPVFDSKVELQIVKALLPASPLASKPRNPASSPNKSVTGRGATSSGLADQQDWGNTPRPTRVTGINRQGHWTSGDALRLPRGRYHLTRKNFDENVTAPPGDFDVVADPEQPSKFASIAQDRPFQVIGSG